MKFAFAVLFLVSASFADDFEDALAAVDSAEAANMPGMYDVNHFEYLDCWVESAANIVARERNRIGAIRDEAKVCGCYTIREKGGYGWRATDEGKKIVKVEGGERATGVFFDELRKFVTGTEILNPLEPKFIDGIVAGDVAVVRDVGFEKDYDKINLEEFERFENEKDIVDEKNGVAIEKAFAVEELNKAREYHLEVEKYFVSAMDFEHNEKLAKRVLDICFG